MNVISGRWSHRATLGLLLTLAFSACSAESTPREGANFRDAVASASATPAIAGSLPGTSPGPLPLDAYVFEDGGLTAINAAVDRYNTTCMKKKGFNYVPAATEDVTASRRDYYGLNDAVQAAANGYGLSTGAGNAKLKVGADGKLVGGSSAVTVIQSTPQYMAALNGRNSALAPPGTSGLGCEGEAFERLAVDSGRSIDLNLVGKLAADARAQSQADPRWLAADQRWSTCMAKKGFDYPDPETAAGAVWPTPVTQVEIDTATGDVDCKRQVNLIAIKRSVEAGYQQRLVDKNITALQAVRELNAARVKKARELNANGG